MSRQLLTQTHQPEQSPSPHASGVPLQRHCSCGNHTNGGGVCAACVKKGMQPQSFISQPSDPLERQADYISNKIMSDTLQEGASFALETERPRLAAMRAAPDTGIDAPPVAREALRSSGHPLDAATRAFFEPRFGYDLSRVRVHSDATAASSARAVNALAYTFGRDVVFGAVQYSPASDTGRRLIAHELTHVLQQSGASPVGIWRQERTGGGSCRGLDAAAQAIVDAAQNTSQPINERAVAVVRTIISTYFSDRASFVQRIVYCRSDERDRACERRGEGRRGDARPCDSGLETCYRGSGASMTGTIAVGDYFVNNATCNGFARRVAQVDHELEHINQNRSGMSGPSRSDEREFLAFHREALFVERTGTGRTSSATRVSLIDAALGYFNCLGDDLKRQHQSRREELVARRAQEARASGRSDLGEAPDACRRPSG